MANASLENSTYYESLDNFSADNTFFTFSLGFGILLIIIVFGILGSAFLCLSLEKDPGNLWPVEVGTQTDGNTEDAEKDDASKENTVTEIVCA